MNDSLLKDLCCPDTRQPLNPAAEAIVARLNAEIKAGTLKNNGGAHVLDAFDEGLLREDGEYLYPVRNGIPVLLVAEAIAVASVKG